VAKPFKRQHFTSRIWAKDGKKKSAWEGRTMDNSINTWRNAAVGLGLTVLVVGAGLAAAFW
jgi:hypothetical protein